MSALPKAVQKQIDEANRISEELAKAAQVPEEDGQVSEENVQSQVPEEDGQVPEENAQAQEQGNAQGTEQPPKSVDYEHKYKVLQGKYDAEVPRMNAQLKDQAQLIADLRQQIANTQTMLAAVATTREEPGKTEKPSKLVTDEEVEAFGPDLYDFIRRAAKEALEPEIETKTASILERVAKTEQKADATVQTVRRTAEEKVLDHLAAAVPDWERQNEDPAFLNWLDEVDPFSGSKRGDLLQQAFRAHDANRVIAFFKSFQNENAAVSSPSGQPAAPVEQEPQHSLEGLVAPGTPKTGTASAPNEGGKRVWTRSDVVAFYSRKNGFVRAGRKIPDELLALEKDLIKAQTEGRIKV